MIREEERRAKQILSYLFREMNSLQKSENPDWVDCLSNIGVEITMAKNERVAENESYFKNHLMNKSIDTVGETQKKLFQKCGMSLAKAQEGGKTTIIGITRVYNATEEEQIFKAIERKYTKNYQPLKRLILYIFAYSLFLDTFSMSSQIRVFETARKCAQRYGEKFNQIIVDFSQKLLLFDLHTERIDEYYYDSKIYDKNETERSL